jgi:hypothetical protein
MLEFFYFYQSTIDDDRTIHQKERVKWPEGTALSGCTLQLTSEVKYLELILDE